VKNPDPIQHHRARHPHDQVLNQLAALANQMDDQRFTPQLQAAYQKTVNSIRDMISGLRPSMLNYGLYSALEELVDDLNKQVSGETELHLNLVACSERYPPEVELHLFRIAQQAVINALQHGGATRVELSGKLLPNSVELSIIDNGKGFDIPSPFDVISLLERQHFGLAGMYERAAIIHATIELQSRPGQGTHIIVRWQPPS
jgi:signal transduction histidine kinase